MVVKLVLLMPDLLVLGFPVFSTTTMKCNKAVIISIGLRSSAKKEMFANLFQKARI